MNRATFRILACCLAAMLTTSGCAVSLHSTTALATGGGHGYRVTAVFEDAAGLPVGGAVRIGQTEAGTVARIRAENFQALVDMDIRSDVDLPASTSARLELTSALGEQYVALDPPPRPGDEPSLAETPHIPLSRTSRGPDVENTLAAVGTLLTGSGIDQVRTIVDEASTMLSGRGDTVRALLADLGSVLDSLGEHRDDLTSIIDSMHVLSGRLAEGKPALEAALTDIAPALETLLAEKERFDTLLDTVTSLGTTTGGLVEATGSSLTEQLHELGPVLEELAGIEGTLGDTLSSLDRFSGLLRRAAPGDYLMLDGTLDVELSVAELLSPDLAGPGAPATGGPEGLLRGGTR